MTVSVLGQTYTEVQVRGGVGLPGASYVVLVAPTLLGNVLELTRVVEVIE